MDGVLLEKGPQEGKYLDGERPFRLFLETALCAVGSAFGSGVGSAGCTEFTCRRHRAGPSRRGARPPLGQPLPAV